MHNYRYGQTKQKFIRSKISSQSKKGFQVTQKLFSFA